MCALVCPHVVRVCIARSTHTLGSRGLPCGAGGVTGARPTSGVPLYESGSQRGISVQLMLQFMYSTVATGSREERGLRAAGPSGEEERPARTRGSSAQGSRELAASSLQLTAQDQLPALSVRLRRRVAPFGRLRTAVRAGHQVRSGCGSNSSSRRSVRGSHTQSLLPVRAPPDPRQSANTPGTGVRGVCCGQTAWLKTDS